MAEPSASSSAAVDKHVESVTQPPKLVVPSDAPDPTVDSQQPVDPTPTPATDSTTKTVVVSLDSQTSQVPPPPPPSSTKPLSPAPRQVSLPLDERSLQSHQTQHTQFDEPERMRDRDRDRNGRYPSAYSRPLSMHRDPREMRDTSNPQAPQHSRMGTVDWISAAEPRNPEPRTPDPRLSRRSLFAASTAVSQGQRTVEDRLGPTVTQTTIEIAKLSFKAKRIGIQINAAIGLQVIVGAIITGLSAISSGRTTQIATSVFGALATIIASYLAKVRGSEEPETSKMHCKELKEFQRDIESFVLDHGEETGNQWDENIARYRSRFEEIQSRQANNRRGMVGSNNQDQSQNQNQNQSQKLSKV